MPYTPVELRHVKLGRSLLGFDRQATERLLNEVADSFEDVWRERGELTDKVEDLERRLEEVRQREALLASTLVAAEKAAAEARETARREAEVIVAEAHGEARSVIRTAQAERERLFAEARRIEALLRSALGLVQETRAEASAGEPPASTAQAELASAVPLDHWPRKEDTREFEAVAPSAEQPASDPPEDPEPPQPSGGSDFAWGD